MIEDPKPLTDDVLSEAGKSGEDLFSALRNPETRQGVFALIEKISPLLRGERLHNVVDLLSLASDGVDMLDDATIQRLMKVYEEGVGAIWTLGNAARYASATASNMPPPSLLGLAKLARQEHVRRGMHFVMIALSVLGQQMSANSRE